MPIPKPRKDEKEKDFISRCMSDEKMNAEYKDGKQRSGVCYTSWKSKDKKKMAEVSELFNGEYDEIKDIEIFNTFSNSHNIKFEDTDLDDMVSQFEQYKDVSRPSVKISHSDQQVLLKELFNLYGVEHGEELPTLGYIDNVRKSGKKLLADITRIPRVLKDVVFGGKHFRSISPEIVMNYQGTGKKFLHAIALTSNPSLKHISDVHMSEGPTYDGNLNIIGGQSMADNQDVKDAELSEGTIQKLKTMFSDMFVKRETKTTDGMITMSEVEKIKAEMQGQIDGLKNELVLKMQEVKLFSEKVKGISEQTRADKAEMICKSAELDGVPPVVVNAFKPILMSDMGESVVKMSEVVDGKEVTGDVQISAIIQNFFKNYPSKINLAEVTRTDLADKMDDKNKRIEKRMKELMSEGMPKHEALIQAGREILA